MPRGFKTGADQVSLPVFLNNLTHGWILFFSVSSLFPQPQQLTLHPGNDFTESGIISGITKLQGVRLQIQNLRSLLVYLK